MSSFHKASTTGVPKHTLIPLVLKQISAQLPYVTQQTLEETESDEFFEYINFFIAKISGSGHYNEVLGAVIGLLDLITANETVSSLEDFKEETLNSLLIVLRLLSDLAKLEWSLINSPPGSKRASKPADQKSVDHVYTNIYNKRLKKLYSKTLSPLESELVVRSVKRLMKLRSKTKVRRAYHTLQMDMSKFRVPPEIINEIDFYCEFVVFFLCASNWDDVYSIIRADVENSITNREAGDIIPRVDELSFLYLDEHRFNVVLKDILKWARLTRNPIHEAFLYYFSQESILYWVEARADRILPEIVNNPNSTTSAICGDLFDNFSNRYQGVSRMPGYIHMFLATIVPLLHDNVYADVLQAKNEQQRLLKLGSKSNGKESQVSKFLNNLDKGLSDSNTPQFGTAVRCYIFMVKAAACFQQFSPKSLLVQLVNSKYRKLQRALYEKSIDLTNIYDLNDLRSDFISKFSFLRPSDVEDDFFLQVGSSSQSLTDKITIFRAVLGIGDLAYGDKRFKKLFALLGTSTMRYIAEAAETILQYEEDPRSISGYRNYEPMVEILTLCLIFFRSAVGEPGDNTAWIERMYDHKTPDDSPISTTRLDHHLTIKAVKCVRSRDKVLHITASNILHDLVRDPRLADDFSTAERPFLLQIFEMIGENISWLTQRIDFLKIQSRDLEDALLRIKRSLDARLYILEHYNIKELIKLDMELLESYNNRYTLSFNLETALLFSICSLNMEICKLALSCLQMAVGEARALDEVDKPDYTHWSFLMSYDAYDDLCSNRQYFTPVSLHRRAFLLFQTLDTPSDAQIKLWKIFYELWEIASSPNVFGFSRESAKQWKTYSGYLASFLVPMLNKDGYNRITPDLSLKADKFIKFMVDTLASDKESIVIESCRDVCASDLSPLTYSSLLVELNASIEGKRQANGKLDIRLVSQAALLLKAIIVRTTTEQMYLGYDISKLMMLIVDSVNDIENLKLSIQVSTLLQAMGSATDTLNLNNEMVTRNKIAHILVGWLSKSVQSILTLSSGKESRMEEFTRTQDSRSNGSSNTVVYYNPMTQEQKDPEVLRLHVEQALEMSKALTLVIDKLPLVSIEGDDGRDYHKTQTKRLFFEELFKTLLTVLRQLQHVSKNMTTRTNPFGSSTGATNRGFLQKIKTTHAQVILSLSNLLTANTSIGLDFSIPLGYDTDLDLRLAFLKIFKNIISRGTKLSSDYNIQATYTSMVNFLVSNITATMILTEVCTAQELDDFSNALAILFERRERLTFLVREAVIQEISQTTSVQGILRRNCVATKLLVFFAKSRGQSYLENTLGCYLTKISQEPEEYPFNKSPNDEPNSGLLSKNDAYVFKKCLEEIVDVLFGRIELIPESIKDVCSSIGDAADRRFPGSRRTAVNGFFFLRFLCPALTSPEKHNLLSPSSAQIMRKCLLFVAKSIQSIANGNTDKNLKVGSNQIQIDAHIIESITKTLAYLSRPTSGGAPTIASGSDKPASSQPSIVSETASIASIISSQPINAKSAGIVHRFIVEHWDEIQRKLMWKTQRERVATSQGSKSITAVHDTINQFTNLVRDLQCVEVPLDRGVDESIHGVQMSLSLAEFISKNKGRDISPVLERHIIEQGTAPDGNPAIIFTVKNYEPAAIDVELLMLRFFELLQSFGSPYYILWDFSCFHYNSQYSIVSLAIGYSMIYQELEESCLGIYYYNVPWDAMSMLKDFLVKKMQTTRPVNSKVACHIITSSKIGDYFYVKSLNLCQDSERMLSDSHTTFYSVNLMLSARTPTPVIIKIGREYLQIEGRKPTKVVSDQSGHFNTTGRLMDLLSVYPETNPDKPPNIFYLEFSGHYRVMTLISEQREEIIKAIKVAEKRLYRKASMPGSMRTSDRHLTQRVDDKLPALLNMGLTNICSSDFPLQQAAYDLLAAISMRFNIGFGTTLIGGPSLGIPCRDITMAVALSTASAKSNPELTYLFLCEFLQSFSDLGPDQRSISINLIVPWINNAYEHIFEADPENGRRKMSSIIRGLLGLSFKQKDQYSLLVFSVWPCLCLEDGLCSLIIEEMLGFAFENSLSEEELNNLLTIVTSFPTLGMTGAVLKIIKDEFYKPLPSKSHERDDESTFENLQILVKITCSLIFNSVLIVESYFPDLLLIVSLLSYIGPNSFRLVVHSLLVNIIHVFTTKTEENGQLLSLWNELCSERLRTSFGISDEESTPTPEFVLFTGIYHLDNITNFLLEFLLYLNANPKIWPEARPWQIRWYSLAMNYSFCDNSDIRTRALIMLGCASKKLVVQEDAVRMLLEYLVIEAENIEDLEKFKNQLTTSFCTLSKMIESLSSGAIYPARLFWLGLSWILIYDEALFAHATHLMQNSLSALENSGLVKKGHDMVEFLLDIREEFSKELELVDSSLSVDSGGRDMFFVMILSRLIRGLHETRTRDVTIKSIEVMLGIFHRNSCHITSTVSTDNGHGGEKNRRHPGYTCFLFMLYLTSQEELKNKFLLAGYGVDNLDQQLEEGELPDVIKSYLAEDSPESTIVLCLASQVFRLWGSGGIFPMRFTKCIEYVHDANNKKKRLVYSVCRDKVVYLMEHATTRQLARIAINCGVQTVVNDDEFACLGQSRAAMKDVLTRYGFTHTLYYLMRPLNNNGRIDLTTTLDGTDLNTKIIEYAPLIRAISFN